MLRYPLKADIALLAEVPGLAIDLLKWEWIEIPDEGAFPFSPKARSERLIYT